MNIITLDIESFFSKDFGFRTHTTEEYIRSPLWETIGVSTKVNDGPIVWVSDTHKHIKEYLRSLPWHNHLLLAQNCVTGDHEVRTKDGWVRFDQLADGVEVMQWNPENEIMNWTTPKVIRKPYEGKMYEWDSNFHKGIYTPEHRIYTKTPDTLNKNWGVKTAAQVATSSPNNTYIPAGGIYKSASELTITPAVGRLIEMTRADGYIQKTGKQIRFHFKKQRKVDRCVQLLDALGMAFTIAKDSTQENCVFISVHTCRIVERIRELLGVGKQKGYSSWVLDLQIDTRLAILDEMQYWDGYIYNKRNKGPNKSVVVHSAKASDIYWINELAVMSGRSSKAVYDTPNTRGWSHEECKISNVRVRTKRYVKTLYKPTAINHRGMVYCLQVSTGAFLVRRQGATWVTGNCAFDGAVLNWIYGIKPVGYLDTQSMANALHGVSESSSLANLANLYGETDKGTEVLQAIGKRRLDFTPKELAAYAEYCKHDTELTYNIFHKMLPNFPKAELRVIDLTIRMFCQPRLELDEALLTKDLINIKRVKRESLEKLITLLNPTPQTLEILIRDGEKGVQEWVKMQVMSNPKFAELLKAQGVEPPTKVSAKTGKTAWAFAKTDEGLTDLLEHENPIVSTLVSTRLENKSTIGETRTEAYIGIAKRGTYPFSLRYSGAKVTHRFSGFDTNPQNLPRGSTLRDAIMTPAGHTLVVADSSAIELRTGLWLAGELDAVQKLRLGIDLYKEFASESFNIPYESISKTSDERFIGKQGQLSLMYQTGENKLQGTIRIQSKGKITIPITEATRLKYLYRDKYRYVVDAWDIGEQILQWIYHNEKHTAFDLLPVHGKKGILKPSGLYLPYPNLRREKNVTKGGMEWCYDTKRGNATIRDKAYGGKCFQRINQSIARDIVTTQTMEINKHYWVAGMVHDEVICVVPDAEVEEAKIVIRDIMRTSPDWAKDLPLDCDVGAGKRYGDAK